MLKQFLAISIELKMFLRDIGEDFSHFDDPDFMCNAAFLADVSYLLNGLNKTLQGKRAPIFELYERIYSFKNRLPVYISDLDETVPMSEMPNRRLESELLDLRTRSVFRHEFTPRKRLDLYASLPDDEFSETRRIARRFAGMFGSTYTCEQVF